MLEFLLLLFYIGVAAFSFWVDGQSSSGQIFFNSICWILILAFCYVRFGVLKDKL